MILYIDENLPRHLARGFNLLQLPETKKLGFACEVRHLMDDFDMGIKDVDWIKAMQNSDCCMLTQDYHITRRKDELKAYREAKLGMFFVKGKSSRHGLTVWEMVELLARRWPEIVQCMQTENRPFAFEVNLKGRLKRL